MFGSLRTLLAVVLAVLYGPAAWAAEFGAVVLLYHRFGEHDWPSTNIGLDQFEDHLAELSSSPYRVLPLPEIVEALSRGEPLPERALAITIDDAFLSVYQEAWPRLQAAGLPVTLFVATEPLDQRLPGYMSWDQLRDMSASELVTVGAQGVTHSHMVGLPPIERFHEIERSNARLRAELGRTPKLFAYPFGEYDAALRQLIASSGYAAAFGQQSGAIGRTSDPYALPRFPLNESFGDLERLRLVLNALPLPVIEVTPRDPALDPAENPPAYGFTVLPEAGLLDPLACYARGQRLELALLAERRVAVRLPEPLPPGRNRVNCTLPTRDGRWRWHGYQFYVTRQ